MPGGGGGAGARRRVISPAISGTSFGGFQSPSRSFQTCTSALFASGINLSTSLARLNGPVRFPSSAMYHCTPSSAESSGAIWPVRRLGTTGAGGAKASRSANGAACGSGG